MTPDTNGDHDTTGGKRYIIVDHTGKPTEVDVLDFILFRALAALPVGGRVTVTRSA